MADTTTLVHLCSPSTWRMALAAGALVPASLVTEGYVHLSTPAQVAVPANARYGGRDDLVLLVVDPARLPGEVRWEPGRPEDPPELRFPHHYGPVPVAAVVAVVAYRPGADGRFGPPGELPGPADVPARVHGFDRSLAQRRAAAVVPVTGGVAVLDPRFPHSYEHNSVWITRPTAPGVITADADRVLGGAGVAHRRVVVDDPLTARGLAALGWSLDEDRLLALTGPPTGTAPPEVPVTAVTEEVVGALWRRSWRRAFPSAGEDVIDQLVAREALADAVIRVVDLAVLVAGAAVASAQLRVDGATASIEAVMTDPDHRGGGRGAAVVHAAVACARAAGADLVLLTAAADDWPREWYTRLGFVDVGVRYQARRPG